MKTRAITGFFFVLIMLASVLLGPYVFTGFFMFLSFLCLLEFYTLVRSVGIKVHRSIGLAAGLIIFASATAFQFMHFEAKFLLLNIPILFSVFVLELYKKSEIPFSNIAYTFLGFIYTIIPFCFFNANAFITGDYTYEIPLGCLLLLWANDTGAYMVGMRFGKHRLFERHSPKKSWEGFFGGFFSSVLVSLLVAKYFHVIQLHNWIAISVLIVCFGTLGDLVESMFKRSIEIKDSGNILPGHGGLLDRFDGLLLSAPVVFVYLYLIMH